MANGPRYKVPFRRRREGRTDYRQRQRLLRGRVPRAVVRTSLRNVSVQIIDFDPKGDEVIASAHSRELRGMGWEKATGNLPAAYLVGFLAGKRAAKAGVENMVLDIGLKVPSKGASAFAALRGLLDAGIAVPHGKEVLPSDERIHGDHISPEMRKLVDEIKIKMEAD